MNTIKSILLICMFIILNSCKTNIKKTENFDYNLNYEKNYNYINLTFLKNDLTTVILDGKFTTIENFEKCLKADRIKKFNVITEQNELKKFNLPGNIKYLIVGFSK